jgi:hypothetical protein
LASFVGFNYLSLSIGSTNLSISSSSYASISRTIDLSLPMLRTLPGMRMASSSASEGASAPSSHSFPPGWDHFFIAEPLEKAINRWAMKSPSYEAAPNELGLCLFGRS